MGISAPTIRRGSHRLFLFFLIQGPIAERRPTISFLQVFVGQRYMFPPPVSLSINYFQEKNNGGSSPRDFFAFIITFLKLKKKIQKEKTNRTKERRKIS